MVRNLNGSLQSFKQDELISFDESCHTYSVLGLGNMVPVSTVVGYFFKPFDAEYWSKKKCFGNALAAAKMREEWASKGAFSSQAGTFLHRQIEHYLNEKVLPESLSCIVSYKGEYLDIQKQIDISREWKFFIAFDNETTYTPFRTEWCIYDSDAKIAGTVDLLCSCPDGTYELYDWKRSNKVNPSEKNRWANGINGLSHLTDTTYIHYCLQQNLYRYILEKNYNIKISRMNLVVLHPEMDSYKIIPVKRMEKEIELITKFMKNKNN